MSVAIRTITRLQDADDAPALGAGQNGYALVWDNASGAFVAMALFTGGLLATGATTGATSQAQAFTNGIIGPSWKPAANSTTALQLQNAAGTAVLNVDTTNSRVGIGTTEPSVAFQVVGSTNIDSIALSNGNVILPNNRYVAIKDNVGSLVQVAFLTSANTFFLGNSSGVGVFSVTAGNYVTFSPNGGTYSARIADSGLSVFTPGSTAFSATTLLHAQLESAATNAVSNVLTLAHNTTGTAAAGFGAGIVMQLESSTTAAQSAARIRALWNDATHASRKADLVLTAYDTAEREGLRIRGDGTGPAIGFYGVTPIARAVLATGAGASVDDVITALQNLGLVKQS